MPILWLVKNTGDLKNPTGTNPPDRRPWFLQVFFLTQKVLTKTSYQHPPVGVFIGGFKVFI